MAELPTGDNGASQGSGTDELYYLKPEDRVDLTNCDREPIHIIAHVQPHGFLLALDPENLTIRQASANTSTFLGVEAATLTGQRLQSLLGTDGDLSIKTLMDAVASGQLEKNPRFVFRTELKGHGPFHVVAHTYRGVLLLEAESVDLGHFNPEQFSGLRTALARFDSAHSVIEFAQVACEEIRRIMGFHRVMLYRFLDDESGEVIAEDLDPDVANSQDSYLGLRYPASDIPKQARALFVLNTVRVTPDVGYEPARLVPMKDPVTGSYLDLSYCLLRGQSSIHLEYLKNMGVCASVSLAVVRDGRLWGLFAAHHYEPKPLSYDVRSAIEYLTRVVSLQMPAKEREESAGYTEQIHQVMEALVANLALSRSMLSALASHTTTALDLMHCGGCAVVIENEYRLLGTTPPEDAIHGLIHWLNSTRASAEESEELVVTNSLMTLYPPAELFLDSACGLLAMPIPGESGDWVLWFRPELVHTITWGGNPNKPYEQLEEGTRLSPRTSFAAWQEVVRQKAEPWQPIEKDAAQRLRLAIVEVALRRTAELAALNRELQRSNDDLDSFAYVASHDLKEPLRGIHNYVTFFLEDHGKELAPEAQGRLNAITRMAERMDTLLDSLLHYSRLGRQELQTSAQDLNILLKDALDSLTARLTESGARLEVPRPLPIVRCEPILVMELLTNIISNGIKYNNNKDPWLEVGYRDSTDDPTESPFQTIYVRDNGIGIAPEHRESVFRIFKRLHARHEFGGGNGAGLTIARKITERHGGRIWIESTEGEGTTVYFTLPAPAQEK
ncbi:MAG: ATP-binding protein [Armatimonas sp.]